MISSCWNDISPNTLRLSWQKILSNSDLNPVEQDPNENVDTDDFSSMFRMIGHDLNETEINDWLYADEHDMGYNHLNDDEIVALAMEETDPQEEMNGDEADQLMTSLVPHSVAVRMFDECLKWLEEQEEASVYNIAILCDLRELAAKKRLSGLNQTRIHNFFSKQ